MKFNLNLILNILVVVLFIALLTWLWYKGKKEMVKKIILSLVIQAEDTFGSGTGPLKYNYVLGKVYSVLPSLIRIFLTEQKLSAMIEDGVQQLKKLLGEVKQKPPETINPTGTIINTEIL